MPLHDWNNPDQWAEVHAYWLVWLAQDIKDKLPAGYRAHIATLPTLTIGVADTKPDVGVVRPFPPVTPQPDSPPGDVLAPDFETEIAVLDPPDLSVVVEYRGILVAAVELISRRNKDRPESRESYGAKYLSYLRQMVNLMIVDVLPRPHGFSFADQISSELHLPHPPTPAPVVVSYRVDGRLRREPARVAGWLRPLAVGTALPILPLAINHEQSVVVDLEATYMRAAASAYLA